jgi:hypothetical protein
MTALSVVEFHLFIDFYWIPLRPCGVEQKAKMLAP